MPSIQARSPRRSKARWPTASPPRFTASARSRTDAWSISTSTATRSCGSPRCRRWRPSSCRPTISGAASASPRSAWWRPPCSMPSMRRPASRCAACRSRTSGWSSSAAQALAQTQPPGSNPGGYPFSSRDRLAAIAQPRYCAAMPKPLFGKSCDSHLVARRADGRDLVYIDRHVLHELHAPHAFEQLDKQQRPVRRPDLTFSMQDHPVATRPGRDDTTNPSGAAFLKAMREGSRRNGIRLFDIDDPEQGISHVVAPELGMVLPGATHAVPDSHASTVGGLGALAFGCGTSELAHILATQVMALRRPKRMRVRLEGRLGPHVTAKDVALRLIGDLGVAGARGYAVEYAGAAVRAMAIESRMTLCNLNIEMGGLSGFVAPDESTFSWIAGRPFAPQGAMWDAALAHWRMLASEDGAAFDREHGLDCSGLEPQITWGTDPSQVLGISGRVPDPSAAEPGRRAAVESALAYMGLAPGMALAGLKVDRVFIGSCTNSRLPDLAAAAEVVRGRRVADGVVAMVVPGSTTVKREAEAAGLDRVFRDAGFFWGESGCSMCDGGNGDRGEPGERCVSTTNRNFEHRQGPKVRTHLVSPATAAATAVMGRITDVRRLTAGQA